MRVVLATKNPSKCREMERLLAGLPVEVVTLREFPGAPQVDEDEATLERNAAKKAAETARACGAFAVADDSGLFVDALEGEPGVRSARYAGADPTTAKLCTKLLGEMAGIPDGRRRAHFRCCIAAADADGRIVLTASGRVDGVIAREMRGGNGFGYDPVFVYGPTGTTFAEMADEEKDAVSHRGQALREFRRALVAFLRYPGG
jgi:XTP/dITP diphosphohydrolase